MYYVFNYFDAFYILLILRFTLLELNEILDAFSSTIRKFEYEENNI